MRAVCIQPQAFDLPDYKSAFNNILEKIDDASRLDPDLIVIPECVYPSYYLGSDPDILAEAMAGVPHVIEQLAEKAKSYRTYLAFGLVVHEDGRYYNRGLLFSPEGGIVAEVNKSFLWHFDNEWFAAKDSVNIVDTPFGKWGMIICADGRMPELVRELALKGVDLVVDIANLTSTGKDSSQLTNAQSSFMLSTRALENNVWLIMADKVGVEGGTVVYSGRSSIISSSGDVIIEASPDDEEIIFADIDPLQKASLGIDVINDRVPATYGVLSEEQPPLVKILREKVVPGNLVIQGSAAQFKFSSKAEYLSKASYYIKTLENQMAELIVLPGTMDVIEPEEIQPLVSKPGTMVFFSAVEDSGDGRFISLHMVQKDRIGSCRQTHVSFSKKERFGRGREYMVYDTPKGNVGVMIGEDGLFPEVARILTLKGADCIIWINSLSPALQEKVARTRAAENKVFLITSSSLNEFRDTVSFVADPNGVVIASTLAGREQALATQIPLVLSRCKVVVPGTHATNGRRPDRYSGLIMENLPIGE